MSEGRIIGMLETGSAASHLGPSHFTVRRYWDQRIRQSDSCPQSIHKQHIHYLLLRSVRSIARPDAIAVTITCTAIATLSPSPPFGKMSCSKDWPATKWDQVVFSIGSRLDGGSEDNRARVWSPRAECLKPALGIQRHTTPTTDVRV
ncbi:hypothetical protein TNCV_2159861 [Trichonephila clavipes]|nr:hypothetical protein TNCV_2159861 [Trichonephila clavipes]